MNPSSSFIFLSRSSPHLPALSFPSCIQTQTLLHHPAGTVTSMCLAVQVLSMGQDCSEGIQKALTGVIFSWTLQAPWPCPGLLLRGLPAHWQEAKIRYLQVCKWKKVENCCLKPAHFLLAAAGESLFLGCFPQLASS